MRLLRRAIGRRTYAQKVRQTLLASKDTELLTRTVEQLQCNRPNLEFSRSLIDRVLSIDPKNQRAHMRRDQLQRFALKRARKRIPAALNDSDRMMLLESQLYYLRPVPRAS